MNGLSDEKIIESWEKNVHPWVNAIRKGEIESRLLVTDQAIIDTVLEKMPISVLDVGCGEGWLVRVLDKAGVNALGIDVVEGLIEHAKNAQGNGRFRSLSFEELTYDVLQEKFDVIVCNFSLLGNESVTQLFNQFPSLLNKNGAVIVQTIHPVSGCGDQKYEDGWREGSWKGFNKEFYDPAPWYFRTLESWKALYLEHGFALEKLLEPLNPKTKTPASAILVGVYR